MANVSVMYNFLPGIAPFSNNVYTPSIIDSNNMIAISTIGGTPLFFDLSAATCPSPFFTISISAPPTQSIPPLMITELRAFG